MQVRWSATSRKSSSAIWFFAVSLPLLVALAGCGGAVSPGQAQTQLPTAQPALSGGTGSSDSGSQSSSSGGSSSSGTSSSGSSSGASNGSGQSSNGSAPPAGATTKSAVQTLPNWSWCTAKLNGHVCASGLGNARSSMTPDQSEPSLSGKSAVFKIAGKTAYSNALWWRQFGPDSTSTHFVYDLYFYMKDPSAPEALEFDINQSMNGTRWTWGTECSYRNTGYWDIWNSETLKWETTSVPCPVVSANTWHHLTWTVERVNGQAHYISVALDGKVTPVDKYYNPQPNYKGAGVNVAFQLDGDYRQDPYSVWLDKVSLTSW